MSSDGAVFRRTGRGGGIRAESEEFSDVSHEANDGALRGGGRGGMGRLGEGEQGRLSKLTSLSLDMRLELLDFVSFDEFWECCPPLRCVLLGSGGGPGSDSESSENGLWTREPKLGSKLDARDVRGVSDCLDIRGGIAGGS
jgi:hypothetical protein